MSKIAIIIGHYVKGKDKGAVNYKGEPESLYNLRIAQKLKTSLASHNIEVKIFTRDEYVTFARIAEGIRIFGAKLSIELHFNSFAKAALGCECLALAGDQTSILFSDLLTDKISDIMKVSERHDLGKTDGVLIIAKGGRGFNNLNIVKKVNKLIPVVLIEPCFANLRTKESEKFFESEYLYVQSIETAVLSWLQQSSPKASPTIKPTVSPKNIKEKIVNVIRSDYK